MQNDPNEISLDETPQMPTTPDVTVIPPNKVVETNDDVGLRGVIYKAFNKCIEENADVGDFKYDPKDHAAAAKVLYKIKDKFIADMRKKVKNAYGKTAKSSCKKCHGTAIESIVSPLNEIPYPMICRCVRKSLSHKDEVGNLTLLNILMSEGTSNEAVQNPQ